MIAPNFGDLSARLDEMEATAHTGKVAAFKVYTAWGPNGRGFSLDDPAIGLPVIQKAHDLGVKVFIAHKGLPLVNFDPSHNGPDDIVAVSRQFPDMQFVVFHGAWDKNHVEGPYDPNARIGIDTFLRALDAHGVPPNDNVWVDVGTVWREVLRDPTTAAHTLGKLLKRVGSHRVLWGTDAIWYGSPQAQLQAFRVFTISNQYQDQFGYPALTGSVKDQVLGLNAGSRVPRRVRWQGTAVHGLSTGDPQFASLDRVGATGRNELWSARVIEATGLSKRYGSTLAVDDLSFTVPDGRVTGFLGPNGAGKSTTMRLIVGLDAPSAGRITVNGASYHDRRFPLHEVGALLEAKAIHPSRSARNHLRWLAQSNGISPRRVDEVLEQVGISAVARKRAGTFSLGMSQRLGIAAALLGDPEVLLLDEPVNGLDPEGIQWVRRLLRSLAAEGRTVFVSSHLMSEMALTADHLIVIGKGRLIADASVEEVIAQASANHVKVVSPQAGALRPLIAAAGADAEPRRRRHPDRDRVGMPGGWDHRRQRRDHAL